MDSNDDEQSGLLSNFLFGNIDEDGRLETDFIDDVSFMWMKFFFNLWIFSVVSLYSSERKYGY